MDIVFVMVPTCCTSVVSVLTVQGRTNFQQSLQVHAQYLCTSLCSKPHVHKAHGAANICARVCMQSKQGKRCLLMLQSADEARAAFEDAPNVSVVEMHINDAWARDWGPTVSLAICS